MVRSWVEQFKAGRNNVHGDDRSGWPSDTVNDETIAGILALFERDRRYTITDLKVCLKEEFLTDISCASICRVLQETGFTKVCVRWVPQLLSNEHRANCFDAALSLLLVTKHGYIKYLTPEIKRASKVWKTNDERAPKKRA